MNEIISKAALEARKLKFQPGTRVELVSMNDSYTNLKPGDRGEVVAVDSIGTIHCVWDNGSTLGVAFGADCVKLVPPTITDEIKSEIEIIRKEGRTNMFDSNAVQRIAFDKGFYATVDYIETDRKAYSNYILTGKG